MRESHANKCFNFNRKMKMLFKGHSTRLEMLIEKIHSNKESSCQDSGSTSSDARPTSSDNLPSDSPKSHQSYSDTEEEKDWEESLLQRPQGDESSLPSASSGSKFLQFSCGYCPRQFKHKRSRDRHTKLHTGDKKYKCVQCESAFARSDHLKIHMKTHDSKKQFKCTKCNKGYNTASAFSFHEKTHKGENPSGLEDCEEPEVLQSALWQNSQDFDAEESPDIKTICVYCFQWFSSVEMMRDHIQTCHSSLDDKKKLKSSLEKQQDTPMEREELSLKRPKEEFLPNEESPKRHNYEDLLKSQDAFICSCCYEALPNFKSFLFHMETHVSSIKNKIFQNCEGDLSEGLSNTSTMVALPNYVCCCYCSTLFESNDKLQEHLIERHVVTLYKCSLCDNTFEEVSAMKSHLNAQHMKNYEHFECHCLDEPKLFHDRVSAELHVSKYHSPSSKAFSEEQSTLDSITLRIREEYLDNVSKTASTMFGQSAHRCAYCKEFCKTKTDLHLHLRSHQLSEKSRHKCNICDETFGTPAELASHKLVHCKIIEGNVCMPCKAIITDEDCFMKHQLKHNDNSKSSTKLNLILPYICIVCGQTLQSDNEIELHAKFHLKFLCDHRSKSRDSEAISYNEEPAFVSKEPSKNTPHFSPGSFDVSLELQCHLCKKPFSSKDKLQVHLIEHNFFGINQYNCYVCSSVFTAASGLQSHLLGHNLTEKPYQCSRCSAGFYFRAELDNHKYLHNFKDQFEGFSEESMAHPRHYSSAV